MYGLASTMSVSKNIFAEPRWDIFIDDWGNVDLRRFRAIMETMLQNGKFEYSTYETSVDYTGALPGYQGYCQSVYRLCKFLNVAVTDKPEEPDYLEVQKDIISVTLLDEATIYAFYNPKTLKLTSMPTPATGIGTVTDRNADVAQFVDALTLPADYETSWADFGDNRSKISMGGDVPNAFLNAWPCDNTGEPMEFHGVISGVEDDNIYVFFNKRTALSSDSERKHYGIVLDYSEIDSNGYPTNRSLKTRYNPKMVESSTLISAKAYNKALPTPQMTFNQSVYEDFKETEGNKRIVAKFEPFSEDVETIYGEGMSAWIIKDYGDGKTPIYEAFYVEL